MSLLSKIPPNALFLSKSDVTNPLAACSPHDFQLDGAQWPSVEHYFQATKFNDEGLKQKIREASHPQLAEKMAKRNFWKKRKGWKKIQLIVMTRATYTKCRTHAEVAEALLATGDQFIVEESLYDNFWGCGRDQLGYNHYGKVLMDVRARLLSESEK